jgi:hypothetical protein
MAEKIILSSDLTGTDDTLRDPVQARLWALGDESLRMDLTDSEYERFREAVKPWYDVSRPAQENKTRTVRRSGRESQTEGARAKRWANQHGAELPPRGPCPAGVLEAFQKDDPELLPHRVNGVAQ